MMPWKKQRTVGSWLCLTSLASILLLGGCSAWERKKPVIEWPDLASTRAQGPSSAASAADAGDGSDKDAVTDRDPQIYRGTGRFVGPISVDVAAQSTETGDITLNFQNADLKEVVTVVLGDLLQLNYVLDPAVQGAVTLQTTRPLRREDLLPTLETLLRMHGFAAVKGDDGYRVMPLAKAIRGQLSPQLGRSSAPIPSGYSLRVVPLAYISAGEMAEILRPIVPDNSIVRVDALRNLLILAGTGQEVSHILDTIEVFDVDWVKGMSVGFFPLQNAQATEVEAKLQAILGAQSSALQAGGPKAKAKRGASSAAGMFRIAVVESANGLLVVTPQPDYLETVGQWIERLDRIEATSEGERELFVYRVKSGEAATLAELLNALVGGERTTVGSRRPLSLAPGERPVNLGSDGADNVADSAVGSSQLLRPAQSSSSGGDAVAQGGIRIVADDTRNSLLITATAREYRKILKALSELDIPPLQVMIEATIIEVQLKGDLEFGLQWFFNVGSGEYRGNAELDGTLDSATDSGRRSAFPGFNFTVVNGLGEVRAVFSALAEDSLINVLSSPSVMVLDNGTARIQVGDQVPIATQQQQSTSETANLLNTIQYRDTGIVLEVTPRVTPGGLVTMVVDQEVSDVSATQTSTLDSPTITTRRISSSVAVQDGQAVVLGGLIRERKEGASGGVPLLKDVPAVGWLFGQQSDSSLRTELVVILTPRVVVNPGDVARVTSDFRARMQGLEGAF